MFYTMYFLETYPKMYYSFPILFLDFNIRLLIYKFACVKYTI